MSSPSPSQLGRYEIQAVLGKGSMGIVYLARDPLIGRLVALKTFRPNIGGDDEDAERFRTRFLREAQSAGILSHPNIVTVHDVVESSQEGATFIAMEYVQGTNLKEVLRYGKALEMGEVVAVLQQMAGALDYAHGKGVVHRDVKPANVLLTPQRQVKLTDFGIARFEASNLTHDGQLLGTPNYMSPEQVQGREVDKRTDLFSLGVVLYEMITRHKPFSGESLTAVTHRIVYDKHTPLERYVGGLPEPLTRMVDRSLAKDPAKRFQSAQEMADELTRVVAIYEQQIALSETQSVDAPLPPEASGVSATDGDATAAVAGGATPPRGVPRPPAAPVATTSGSRPAAYGSGPGSGSHPSMAGTGAGAATGTGGTGGTGAAAGAGGVLHGFRRWLKPEPGFGAPDWPRLGLVALVVAVLVLGFGYLMLGWMDPGDDLVEAPTAAERVELEYMEAMREGQLANERGDPVAAAIAFRRAEALRPGEARARRLREAAERRVEMENLSELARRQLALQAAAAEEALAAGRYQEALSTATVVLESDPENASAQQVARRARSALARQAQAAREEREAEEEAAEETAAEELDGAPGEDDPAEMSGESTLDVRLETEGDGRLVVRVDGTLVADIGYNHSERVGLFRRKRTYRGVSKVPNLEVEAGERAIRYEVRPEDGPPQVGTLDAVFPPGETRSLVLTYMPGETLAARVE